MVNAAPDFLTLPARAVKPRRSGITHVLDKGLPVDEVDAVLGVCGAYVDVWKLGWGTAYLDPGLRQKLAVLGRHDVLACVGGTLLEVAWHQGVESAFMDWAADVGFPCVEVSCGAVTMNPDQRRRLTEAAAERFLVFSEIGSKDISADVDPAVWARDASDALATGATWVVTEGRESGTVGLYDRDGSVRERVVDAVAGAVGSDRVLFEAPRKDQQAWLLRRFGADANLANIAVGEVLGLEALRLGLRADTLDTSSGPVRAR